MSFLYIPNDDTPSYMANLQAHKGQQWYSGRLAAFLPIFAGTWLDSWCTGCSIVLFVVWWKRARKYECRTAVCTLCFMFAACIILSGWNLSYLIHVFAAGYAKYDTLAIYKLWPRWYGLMCLAVRAPASVYFLHRAYTLNGSPRWVLAVGATLILSMVCAAAAHTALLAIAPTGSAVRVCSLISAASGVLSDTFTSGMTVRSWYRLDETRLEVKEHRLVRVAFSVAEVQAPALLAGLILFILTLARAHSAQRLLCHPKLSLICVILTMKRQSSIRRSIARSQGIDSSLAASASFGHKVSLGATMSAGGAGGGTGSKGTLATLGHGSTLLAPVNATIEPGQHPQPSPMATAPRFGARRPANGTGPGSYSYKNTRPPGTASSFESAMLQETEAPFIAYTPYPNSNLQPAADSVDTLPASGMKKDQQGEGAPEIQQSPGYDTRTNGSMVSDDGEQRDVGESQIALVHAQ